MISSKTTFWGYRRENGRVGVRNYVAILPVDDISNAACEAVANNIKGTLAIPHPYGRLQFGADLELHFQTLIGTGANPNVAAVVVIGIEDQWTKRVVDGIKKTGKPVMGFGIEGHGDIATVGITDHAQEALGDIVFLELPEAGKQVKAGQEVAVVESVKAASDIYAPLSGEIVESNAAAAETPESINADAYAAWLFKIKPSNLAELDKLLDAAGYAAVADGE